MKAAVTLLILIGGGIVVMVMMVVIAVMRMMINYCGRRSVQSNTESMRTTGKSGDQGGYEK